MLKITWATDIHLDHAKRPQREALYAELAQGDVIVLTGDLATAGTLLPLMTELGQAVAPTPVYFVLGNHDFYGGNFRDTRKTAELITREAKNTHYLPECGVVSLTPSLALVGVDGWADGGYGNWETSDVVLNDYVLIHGLAHVLVRDMAQLPGWKATQRSWRALKRLLEREAYEQTNALLHTLHTLDLYQEGCRRLLIATHVPPWQGATWHEGKHSDDNWAPHFSSRVMGDMLTRFFTHDRPDLRAAVLCGHSHGEGVYQPSGNLVCFTGAAQYGFPAVAGWFEFPETEAAL